MYQKNYFLLINVTGETMLKHGSTMQEERLSTLHKLWKNYGPNSLGMMTRRFKLEFTTN